MNSIPFKHKLAREVEDWDTIQQDSNANARFNDDLFEKIKHSNNYTHCMEQIIPTARAAASKTKKPKDVWFRFGGPELPSLIEHRDNLLSKIRDTNEKVTNNANTVLKESNKRVKDAVEQAKAKYASFLANKTIEMDINPKNTWIAIREIVGGLCGHHAKPKRMAMKMENGKKSANDKEHMSVFQPHFAKLYNKQRSPYANAADFIKQREKLAHLDANISWEEFITAVNDLKNDKAPGLNGVPPNAFKAMDEKI